MSQLNSYLASKKDPLSPSRNSDLKRRTSLNHTNSYSSPLNDNRFSPKRPGSTGNFMKVYNKTTIFNDDDDEDDDEEDDDENEEEDVESAESTSDEGCYSDSEVEQISYKSALSDPKERTFVSQASTLSNQKVPGSFRRTFSAASTYIDSATSSKQSSFIKEDKQATINDINKEINPEDLTWKEYIVYLLYKVLKLTIFQLFMIYWLLKEPIIRIVTLCTMIVSTFAVTPALYFWSKLSKSQNLMPSMERRRQITSWCTFLIFIVLSFNALQNYGLLPHAPESFHYASSVIKSYLPKSKYDSGNSNSQEYDYSSTISKLHQQHNQLMQEQVKIWSAIDKHKIENEKIQATLNSHQTTLHDHQATLGLHQDTIKDQQTQLNMIQTRIDKDLRKEIEHILPDMVLVNTDKNGRLELSPQFYSYLQDKSFWSRFLKQNQDSIDKYLEGEMNKFLSQQQKQGAIINKETFMKLISNDLSKHITSQDGETIRSLVDTAISRYHQDVLNTRDYALQSMGARIIHGRTSPTFVFTNALARAFRRLARMPVYIHKPELVLMPKTHIGECWSMVGQNGTLGIQLSEGVAVKSITIEYPSKQVALDAINAAPKDIEVYGMYDHRSSPEKLVFLGQARYDIEKEEVIQTFDLNMNPSEAFKALLFKIVSNWGNKERTDVYRIRVHGLPVQKE